MRNYPAALKALFPTVRGDILAATLTQSDKWWYLSELAQFLRTTRFESAAGSEGSRRRRHSATAP